jgi:hypothetical protein
MLDGSVCASDKQKEVETTIETKKNTSKRHLFDGADGKILRLLILYNCLWEILHFSDFTVVYPSI